MFYENFSSSFPPNSVKNTFGFSLNEIALRKSEFFRTMCLSVLWVPGEIGEIFNIY